LASPANEYAPEESAVVLLLFGPVSATLAPLVPALPEIVNVGGGGGGGGAGGCSVTVAVAKFAGSPLFAAFTVTLCWLEIAAGAV
jgi:hypothetical protein